MKRYALAIILPVILFIASSCAVQMAQVNPEDEVTKEEHQKLASVYETKGEYELAEREYSAAVALDKNDAGLYFALGNVYAKMIRFKDARLNYAKVVDIDPKNAAPYNNLGWAYMEEGALTKAEAATRTALDLDGTNRPAYLDTLAEIKLRSGDGDGAEALLLEAASIVKNDRPALKRIYTHLIAVYIKFGKAKKADEIVKKIKGL